MSYNAAFMPSPRFAGAQGLQKSTPPTPVVPFHRVGRKAPPKPEPANVIDAREELTSRAIDTLEQIKIQREALARETEAAINAIVAARAGLVKDTTKSRFRKQATFRDRKLGDLLKLVSAIADVPVAGILSRRQDARAAKTRFVLYWLATRFTDRSLPAIGRAYGGRDHTTILYGMRRCELLVDSLPNTPGSDTPACWARLLLAQPDSAWPRPDFKYEKK